MVFKLVEQAEKHWRRMNGYALILKLNEGVRFKDGIAAGMPVLAVGSAAGHPHATLSAADLTGISVDEFEVIL